MAAQVSEIKAQARSRSGKGGARATRREDRVPGVVYGDGGKPENISLNGRELNVIVGRGKFLSTVFDLDVDGKKSRVIPRDVQLDPVKDWPIHVDFQRVGSGARIRVNVPVRFINEGLSPGLKRGGVLNIVRHDVEVTCPADAIPDHFEFNLEGLEIGRSVHISAVKMPDGVKPTILNRDFTICHGRRPQDRGGGRARCRGRGAEGAVPAEGEAAAATPKAATPRPPAGKEAAGGKAAGRQGGCQGTCGQARCRQGQEVGARVALTRALRT